MFVAPARTKEEGRVHLGCAPKKVIKGALDPSSSCFSSQPQSATQASPSTLTLLLQRAPSHPTITMKFFAVAALFAATAMAYPPSGNAGALSQTKVQQVQTLENRCNQQQKQTMCCDKFTEKKSISTGGLLNNLIGDLDLKNLVNLGLVQNLLQGEGGECRGVVTALDGNCANKAACCDHIDGSATQNGLVNVNGLNCLALPL
ncbi:hypothetical protein BDV28DRAFT_86276 [Aspergillus coremiiformis]|uniref:Hydrophobin n=1 Tax=Aspergillus coremiiformis TaxID=138285 RepID=A0A5N6Z9N5_9EURO|nr:hypothetical protein BDV28DRAFT_86276 [Aspergillus coremiiformis]